eukprot:scaffold53608_cov30-Tisochrysis_lutea.AAC.1
MLCSRHGASDLGAGAEASKAAVRNPPPPSSSFPFARRSLLREHVAQMGRNNKVGWLFPVLPTVYLLRLCSLSSRLCCGR